jgi:ATP-dependent protease ClpP protease subunit
MNSSKPARNISISCKAGHADILLFDEIGQGMFGGVTASDFAKQLSALGKVEDINVRINSPGGDVFDGLAIYNSLKAHPAPVNVRIDGLAASIASVIAMAGDTVEIAETALFMAHNPWSAVIGEANDLRKMADTLDLIKGQLQIAYARSGKTADELSAIMDAETWLTGAEAVSAGFCDSLCTSAKRLRLSEL